MEEAIRDVFPYGPAEIIIMYVASIERKELHEELRGKIEMGERLLRHTYRVYGVYVKNGYFAYNLAFNMNLKDVPWEQKCVPPSSGRMRRIQHEPMNNLKSFKFLRPKEHSKIPHVLNDFRHTNDVRYTRQLLIDYLTDNGFQKIHNKSKHQLVKLAQSF